MAERIIKDGVVVEIRLTEEERDKLVHILTTPNYGECEEE